MFLYTVRGAATTTRGAAEAIELQLPSGIREVAAVVEVEPGKWVPTVGTFPRHADARLVERAIEGANPDLAFDIVREDVNPSGNTVDAISILPPLFRNTAEGSAAMACQNLFGDPRHEEFEALNQPDTKSAYIRKLLDERPGIPNEDPLAGYIDLNLGILAIRAGDHPKGLGLLRPVADGDVAASAIHRMMAMRRVAWVTHQQNDKLQAYRMYWELYRFSDRDFTRSQAIVEISALLVELARSGQGDLAEVRNYLKEYRSQIPEELTEQAATADLVYLESCHYQDQFQKAVDLIDDFAARHGAAARKETAMALSFKGLALFKLDDYPGACEALESILAMELGPKDHYQAIPDMKVHALNWLINLSERKEEPAKVLEYKTRLREYEASKLAPAPGGM